MSKSTSPLLAKPATAQSASPGSSEPASNGSTVPSTQAESKTTNGSKGTGLGHRRFRGDVPAFNPSGQSLHLYSPQMHHYPPQAPGSSPLYPGQQPQYYPQQPQFVPFGGSMVPYYPVALNYQDYSMYSPYQYYSMSAHQYQNPATYMGMNGMNGFVPNNRKKHTKSSPQYNSNNNNNNNQNNISSNGSSHSSGNLHPNASIANSDLQSQGQSLSSNLPSSLDLSDPTPELETRPTTENTPSNFENGESAASLKLNTADEEPVTTADDPVSPPKNQSTTRSGSGSPLQSSKYQPDISIPLFFNLSLQDFLDERNLSLPKNKEHLESKTSRLHDLLTSSDESDFCLDTSYTYLINDHNNGTEYLKEAFPSTSAVSTSVNSEPKTPSAAKPPMNWASLLQTTKKQVKKANKSPLTGTPTSSKPGSLDACIGESPLSFDSVSPQPLGVLLMRILYDPTFDINSCEPFKLKPRGLTNTGNICYMNAVLQCLMFCAPFSKLLRLVEEQSIGQLGTHSTTPLLDATIKFINDFKNSSSSGKSNGNTNSNGIVVGRPLSPENLYLKLIESPKFQHLKWGQQEDAEEFLVYFLDGLHEEFVKAESTISPEQMEQLLSAYRKNLNSLAANDLKLRMKEGYRLLRHSDVKNTEKTEDNASTSQDNEWSEVSSRRKVSKKRVAEIEPSPITELFGGRFRSVLTVPKSKESQSITVDPFRCIQLDISHDSVETIEDALWKLNEVEELPYKNEDGNEVLAQKQTYIEDLPAILTLQLKRFSFQNKTSGTSFGDSESHGDSEVGNRGMGTIEKVLKDIKYNLDLKVPVEALSLAGRAQYRNYSLIGVIYHHGNNAEGGHYTCDVLREEGKWLRIDDTAVESIEADSVTEKPDAKDKSAYILLYQRKSLKTL